MGAGGRIAGSVFRVCALGRSSRDRKWGGCGVKGSVVQWTAWIGLPVCQGAEIAERGAAWIGGEDDSSKTALGV